MLINLIAVGLLEFARDKINKNSLNEKKDHLNELRILEHLVKNDASSHRKKNTSVNWKEKQEKKTCKIF